MNKNTGLIESGVYLLLDKEEIVYIGESGGLYSRIGSHQKKKVFNSFRILPCKQSRRKYWEKVLIKKYKPKYNRFKLPKGSTWKRLSVSYEAYRFLQSELEIRDITSSDAFDYQAKLDTRYRHNQAKLEARYSGFPTTELKPSFPRALPIWEM